MVRVQHCRHQPSQGRQFETRLLAILPIYLPAPVPIKSNWKVSGPLASMWESQMDFQSLGFGVAQLCPLQAAIWHVKQQMKELRLFLDNSFK